MSDRFTFSSAGQQHELEMAMDRVGGWDAALVKVLCMGNNLGLVRDVLLGHAEVKVVDHIINCDVEPIIPNGWSLTGEGAEHQKGGQWKWDHKQVNLFLSGPQQKGKTIGGHDLRKELKGKPVLNACVLDYLLKNPHLIPDEWKGKAVFFWGTIYRRSDGDLYVSYLYWSDGRWLWNYIWLGSGFDAQSPAALRASC